ncbi:response regulator transcription factor [Euzebya tangerina]|uniref:response regulator transcription factor n=1 Tax=Euzebya tangerina TaxID=591198 RepID=UPI0023E8F235|nr:response regulator transcription factor [Euzebya tangerina]
MSSSAASSTSPSSPAGVIDVLVVDDDAAILSSLSRALRLEGYDPRLAAGGLAALEAVKQQPPALVILDVGMPDVDGVAVTRRLRADGFDMPICILSARDEITDRVAGLEAGADDYVVKPFALEELLARMSALLRRAGHTADSASEVLQVADLRLDPARREVSRDGVEIELTRREFELLHTLMTHADRVLSRAQLLELVWGYDFAADGNVVDVFVGYLRRKTEEGGRPRLIHTKRGVGFMLAER